MARRRPGRFVRPAPKTKIWIGAGFSRATLTTNVNHLLAFLNAGGLALRPFTILRTRLVINFRTDQQAASEAPTGAYGEIVVKETASTIGVTALPGPLTEVNSDWFIYQGVTAPFLFGDATGSSWSNGGAQYIIDSKAMRKVGPDEDVVSMIEMRATGGAFLNVEGRTLIQLH